MSILSVDTIQPIGSGSTVTLNAAKTVVGTGITFESNGQAIYAGIITATSFSGSGANLTSLPAQATIANNADNRVITGGSGVNLNGEANLTFDGTNLDLGDGKYVRLGVSNDFQMWHNGGTGNTNIKQVTGHMYFYTGSDLNMLIRDGTSVDLYYANSKKFETTNTGALITGICTATTFEATTFSKTPTNTPAFHAYRNGSFSPSFPNSTWTKITLLTTETLDTDNAYDNSSSGTTANRFTVPSGKGGYYQVSTGLNFYADSNDLKSVMVAIYKNGGKTMSAYGFISNYTSGVRHFQCDIAGILNLNASDYLEVYAYFSTNGGANNYISNDVNGLRGNYFSAFKLII